MDEQIWQLSRTTTHAFCAKGGRTSHRTSRQDLVKRFTLTLDGRLGGGRACSLSPVTAKAQPAHTRRDADGLYTIWTLR